MREISAIGKAKAVERQRQRQKGPCGSLTNAYRSVGADSIQAVAALGENVSVQASVSTYA